METKGLLVRLREDFFKDAPASVVMAEVKKLTEKDKQDLVNWYNAEGKPTTLGKP